MIRNFSPDPIKTAKFLGIFLMVSGALALLGIFFNAPDNRSRVDALSILSAIPGYGLFKARWWGVVSFGVLLLLSIIIAFLTLIVSRNILLSVNPFWGLVVLVVTFGLLGIQVWLYFYFKKNRNKFT